MGNRTILNITSQTSYEEALAKIYTKAYDDAGCMIWTGSMTSSGYPRVVAKGRATTVRRMLAEKKLGRPLRENEFAASTCNCATCVADEHIRVVTIAKRREETGAAGGYSNPAKAAKISAFKRKTAKLTKENAENARSDPRPSAVVGAELGVCGALIRQLRRGEVWKDYTSPFAGLGAR